MSDSANFKQHEIEVIHGLYLICLLCGKRAYELHHILRKGYDVGFRLTSKERNIMSSVFNCCPIDDCHKRGDIHSRDIQQQLLNSAAKCVHRAIRLGIYDEKPRDYRFIERFSRLYGSPLLFNPTPA